MASINGVRATFFIGRNGVAHPKARPVPPSMRRTIYERDGGRCAECDDPVRLFARYRGDPFVAEVDHIIPLSRGGQTEPTNLRTLCVSCNRSKSNR